MAKGTSKALAAAAALLAVAGLAGCGDQCKTEPVAKVEDAESCTAAPGTPVSVGVQLCPTCNQTGTTCDVEIQGRTIQLDVVSEACEEVSSCPSPTPSCQQAPLACRFTAPVETGAYEVVVYDPQANRFPVVATLNVVSGALASCDFVSSTP